MAYITQEKLKASVPPDFILGALDDDGDGVADAAVWDAIVEKVSEAIDSRLAPRYRVPLSEPVLAIAKEAAQIFAAEALYLRRGLLKDANPWADQAKAMRERLERIGRGEERLESDVAPTAPGGAAITEPAGTYDKDGRLIV